MDISINEISNLALCATIGESPVHSKNLLVTFSSLSLPFNISSVIQVNSVIFLGNGRFGSINSSKRSVMTPSHILTAPISIIWSPLAALKPVVSVSNTTKVVCSSG